MRPRRTLAGWKDADLAARIPGCHPSTILRIRKRQRRASLALALAIERASNGEIKAESLPLSRSSRAALAQLRREAAATRAA